MDDEERRRQRAIALLRKGRRPSEILRELGRSREWLAKWRRRFEEAGPAGLRGRSRAHRAHPGTTSARIVRAVVAARDRLARGRGRQRFAGSGADAVAWELELKDVRPMPARRSIERILAPGARVARRRWRTSAAAGRIRIRGPARRGTCRRPTSSVRVGCAWPRLGLPRIWQVDNETALAGFPAAGRVFTQPVRLALLLGIEVRFIPMGEPP